MKFQTINPNRAIEDYLETIYELSLKNSKVKVSNIAQALQITKASVSQMLNKLAKGKYILYTKYKPIQLTEIGIKIGQEIHHKHQVLENFFDILSIPKEIQLKDIHGIEHYLSTTTLTQIEKLNTKLSNLNIRIDAN